MYSFIGYFVPCKNVCRHALKEEEGALEEDVPQETGREDTPVVPEDLERNRGEEREGEGRRKRGREGEGRERRGEMEREEERGEGRERVDRK